MDSQRQQYIPGPPPLPSQQAGLSHLPPPPPRPYGQTTGLPPPPPGPYPSSLPPGTVYGIPSGWQQSWGRPGIGQGLPPPPPMNPSQLQSQMRGYGAIPGPPGTMMPPPPPHHEKPLLSATFIPGRDSFGPGVGIPPFEDYTSPAFLRYDDTYGNIVGSQSQEPVSKDNRSGAAMFNRGPPALDLRESPPVSPGPPTATLLNPQPPGSHLDNGAIGVQNRQRAQSAAVGVSNNELASQWPLERVLVWLSANGFSPEWQETFRLLRIEGLEFLALGQGGRGFSSRMHQTIYPRLAQVCSSTSLGWDQAREREIAKKLRRAISRLSDSSAGSASAGPGHRRRGSGLIHSASTDGNQELSPHSPSGPSISTVPTVRGEDGLGRQNPSLAPSSFGHHRGPHDRSITLPLYNRGGSASTPSDGRHPDSFANRSEHRGAFTALGSLRRQGSLVHGEGGPGLTLPQSAGSPGGSPVPGHAAPVASGSGRHDHAKSNSVDSTTSYLNRTANANNLTVGNAGSGRFYDNSTRRDAHDPASSNPLDSARANSSEAIVPERGQSPLKKLAFGQRPDVSPDDSIPESPDDLGLRSVENRSSSPGKGSRGSDGTIATPRTGATPDDDRSVVSGIRSPSTRRYVFVTPDHWNYRLIDITDHESAIAIRSIICIELGVADADHAQIYVTEPGQTEHDRPLHDSTLVTMRDRADSRGTLKFYVQSPNLSAISAPQTSTYALPFSNKVATPPGGAMVKSNSTSGATHFQGPLHAAGFRSDRRQPDYFQKHLAKKTAARPASITIKSDRVIDFDSPRLSPYEDKSQTLVPMRKPPVAPSESSTLTKVNSLRKPGEKNRTSLDALKRISDPILEEKDRARQGASGGPSPSSGIGAALVNAGKLAGAPATAGSGRAQGSGSVDQGGSTKPEFTWSKGNMLFKIPAYAHEPPMWPQADRDAESSDKLSISRGFLRDPSPVSPANGRRSRPAPARVKSYGPDLEFKETHITFNEAPVAAEDDSDGDSDDGLFAIPLSNKSATTESLQDVINREPRPTLKLNTDQKATKTRSVAFKSPSSSGPSATVTGEDSARQSSRRFSDDSATFSGSTASPSERRARPDSFVSDIWAHRPAVENVVDHLDQFFPGVDLDQPYLEEGVDLSQAEGGPATLGTHISFGTETMDSTRSSYDRNESDTLGSDESTLKESNKTKIQNVASRQITKSGNGLARMKSVREVAKRRNEVVRGHSVVRTQAQRDTNLVRRKSTKMFGAHIVQIKPKPGHRLSTLDPIPQEDIPTDDTPKRQATFKIIRGQLIGKGTYGRVYLGMNATTGEFLAVKQVEVNQKAAGTDRDRIKEMVAALDLEIDTMQHLEHPNIVQYLGCERKEFSISIYLEYISGGSIGSCLRKHGKFEEPVVRSLTQQTLKGLAYLHDEMILHRDLKADNILLDLDGTCKISDFGISKKSNDVYGNDVTNSMKGSVFWMAPEVIRAQGQGYSAKVDIWSLGCVVLEMFAGKRPWSRDEAIGAIFKLGKLKQAPPIPEDVVSTASVDGLNFMYDCFQVNPTDRPTAETLLRHSTFCVPDRSYNFYDTGLAAKLRTSEIDPSGL